MAKRELVALTVCRALVELMVKRELVEMVKRKLVEMMVKRKLVEMMVCRALEELMVKRKLVEMMVKRKLVEMMVCRALEELMVKKALLELIVKRVLKRSTELRYTLAMMSLFVYVPFLLVLCGTAAGLTKEYVYVSELKTWNDSQIFCRQNYMDLAIIMSLEEQKRLLSSGTQGMINSWIGLLKNPISPNWKWWDGTEAKYYIWKSTQPDYRVNENCVCASLGGWSDYLCNTTLAFFCYRNWILVKENKTWEEAQDFCRRNHHDLAAQTSPTQESLADLEAAGSQTDSVWVGLQFIDGKWFWSNSQPVNSLVPLPSCPKPAYRCGARNINKHVWENRDCNEKLYFICY
ncbi:Aggrecan core protein [Bagarius yarrelli]|uniref:Aggrecan core protein n=1 Tax=Bagarius yarrelli TaxID=175774 RepID=A0A556V1H2_BAGYA|nr:Aggrecan core protein [Bagarius yarrelli]